MSAAETGPTCALACWATQRSRALSWSRAARTDSRVVAREATWLNDVGGGWARSGRVRISSRIVASSESRSICVSERGVGRGAVITLNARGSGQRVVTTRRFGEVGRLPRVL